MNQAQFESKFKVITAKLDESKNSYRFKKKEEIWRNVGNNPLDVVFKELSELYQDADNVQKKQIYDHFTNFSLLHEIFIFVRRVGKKIDSKDDSKWLNIGITVALIDGARADFRDLIISLVLLRFAAEMQGIDTKPFFDNAIKDADNKIKPVLLNVREHEESDIHYTVQTFGPPEWKSISIEMYGKHPSVSSIEERQKDKKQMRAGLRNAVIFFIILGLLVLWNYINNGG